MTFWEKLFYKWVRLGIRMEIELFNKPWLKDRYRNRKDLDND